MIFGINSKMGSWHSAVLPFYDEKLLIVLLRQVIALAARVIARFFGLIALVERLIASVA
ncbi:hypothetical protein [Alkalihalophilus marmarensis]|uniref:hypothetical protein n=1 Tax=Alkalihalophilus marmarensis TaxID=521377 RepID=UPI002DBB6AA1|nr:hypothetical protein [Alkalihalophilus marmarensis]MEC2072549.1 hypothetical protein [Alkalihalophilus marmarensis]